MHRLTRAIVAYHLGWSNPDARSAFLLFAGLLVAVIVILFHYGLGDSSWGPRSAVGLLALGGAIAASAVPVSSSPVEPHLPFSRNRIFRVHWWIGCAGWLVGLLAGVALFLLSRGTSTELPHGIASAIGALIVPSLFGYAAWRVSRPTWGTALILTLGVCGCAACVLLSIVRPEAALLWAVAALAISALLYGLGFRAALAFEPGCVDSAKRHEDARKETVPSFSSSIHPHRWLARWSAVWVLSFLALAMATSATGSRWWSSDAGKTVLALVSVLGPGLLLLVAVHFFRRWLPLAPVALNRHRIARRCLAVFGLSVTIFVLAQAIILSLDSGQSTLAALGRWLVHVLALVLFVLVWLWFMIPGRTRSRWLARKRSRWSSILSRLRSLAPIAILLSALWVQSGTKGSDADLAGAGSSPEPFELAQEQIWMLLAVLLALIAILTFVIRKNIRYATPSLVASDKDGRG